MRDYELKRGTAKVLEGDGLRKIAASVFGDVGTDGAKVLVSYGALEKMVAWTDGKKLFVDTTMKAGVADHIATDTIKAYNAFLEKASGLEGLVDVHAFQRGGQGLHAGLVDLHAGRREDLLQVLLVHGLAGGVQDQRPVHIFHLSSPPCV